MTYNFRIPNLPKDRYQYLKTVRESTGLSPWQVVVLALLALEHLGTHDHDTARALTKRVREEYPVP